jgi:hypothetical protein
MTVSLRIKHLGSGGYDVVPVATNDELTSQMFIDMENAGR